VDAVVVGIEAEIAPIDIVTSWILKNLSESPPGSEEHR
jgi:hypothetical protein